MPALRLNKEAFSYIPTIGKAQRANPITRPKPTFQVQQEAVIWNEHNVHVVNAAGNVTYPTDEKTRTSFRTKAGKRVTPHQWAVYDFVRTIPPGRVTTYKDICVALGEGCPRSVGSALKNNPFAPYVPCHRIIASNLFVGGFCGEWGQSKTGTQCNRKLEMLAQEGVGFNKHGYLVGDDVIWRG